jgi:hypothetical protein
MPLEASTGQQPDISAIVKFHWYEPVHFKHYASTRLQRHIPPNPNND